MTHLLFFVHRSLTLGWLLPWMRKFPWGAFPPAANTLSRSPVQIARVITSGEYCNAPMLGLSEHGCQNSRGLSLASMQVWDDLHNRAGMH